jgi:diphthine-ammonia ligase
MQNAAMLWTGGKDSALALYEASQNDYRICCLATFAPSEPNFLAHPLAFIKVQAQALALPHYVLPIRRPFEKSYETALCGLRDKMGVNTVITGDIAEVAGNPNWIRERGRVIGMTVQTPLWGRDRLTLLRQLLENGFSAIFSCVNLRWLGENWIGRELTDTAIADLCQVRDRTGLDLCGEEGEYHTLITDGPCFKHRIGVRFGVKRARDSLAHLEIQGLSLMEK